MMGMMSPGRFVRLVVAMAALLSGAVAAHAADQAGNQQQSAPPQMPNMLGMRMPSAQDLGMISGTVTKAADSGAVAGATVTATASVLSTSAHANGLGGMLVTTRNGSVVVPADFPRRESKDNRMHACMNPGPMGKMQLICIFTPPTL